MASEGTHHEHRAERDHDLSTTEGVLAYLAGTRFAGARAEGLAGGTANWTYRVYLEGGAGTVVVKHARGYVASVGPGGFKFGVERQAVEVEAMRRVGAGLAEGGGEGVRVPEVYLFDEERHVIVMEDAGEGAVTLKQLLTEGAASKEVCAGIGAALGGWLRGLHEWGREGGAAAEAGALEVFDGNAVGRWVTGWATYGRLADTVAGRGGVGALDEPPLGVGEEAVEVLREVARVRAREIAESRETMTMGDFWPGNVMVDLGADGGVRMCVVDWELGKLGLGGLDVGQFCAEVALVMRFVEGGREGAGALLRGFVDGYAGPAGMAEAVARVAVVHAGAHLAVWTGRVGWGAREQTRAVVREGVDLVVDGYGGAGAVSLVEKLLY
ncbi:hypothetical protein HETIRDRAFT_307373 [Heterobasidion irregulare TC 32-1]|uniref:Aminoglycoside phosphotransferase domain-containing protein n=1 Tax=Heterobasidion irregulare (strain TC 32-1) TaxID=747525 RepID=W4KLN0_HETIT|nr:uncharacterized protein HETIRDRAFT_307373 [Heterobasidion irregulare TC 32-1]ETW86732.1 hypothetical protein HETIRDRAFT_307373 [Heterobasidion irregulare TC 32-1]